MKIKFLYNKKYIENSTLFSEKINTMKKEYNKDFSYEESDSKTFDLLIDNKVIFTLDDNFSIDKVSTEVLIKKIDQHIYSVKLSKRLKNDSKFDDIGLIDF